MEKEKRKLQLMELTRADSDNDIARRWCEGCLDHRFHAPPAYTAQLLTLF